MIHLKSIALLLSSYIICECCILLTKGAPSSPPEPSFCCLSLLRRHKCEKIEFPKLYRTQSADILALNVDGLEEKFDYLSLEDLTSVCQTCQHWKEVSGDFVKRNYFMRAYGRRGNIYSDYNTTVNINCFSQFVQSILVRDGDLRVFQMNPMPLLKEIEFYEGNLTNIEYVKDVLENVETLKFIYCEFKGDFYETFLKPSKNLKRLYVRDTNIYGWDEDVFIGKSNDWLHRNDSRIEHLEVHSSRRNDEVIQFLKQNKNIRKFSTSILFLRENLRTIWTEKIKLDVLSILHAVFTITDEEFNQFAGYLTALQKRGFFNELHLYYAPEPKVYVYPPNLLSFVTVILVGDSLYFNIKHLKNLEHLYINHALQISDLSESIGNITKLKYVHITNDKIQYILPIVRYSPNLIHIKISGITHGKYFNSATNILDLSTLNNERKRSSPTNKLKIYVNEQIYLATKNSFKGKTFSHIEMKRNDGDRGILDFYSK